MKKRIENKRGVASSETTDVLAEQQQVVSGAQTDDIPVLTNECITIDQLIATIFEKTDNWPRSVAGTLFVHDPNTRQITYFDVNGS